MVDHLIETIESVEELGEFEDEYVYDIGIDRNHPYFFANDVLVHNSIYFSAYPVMKDLPDFQDFGWAKEDVVTLYDQIAELTNQSFPEFMKKAFNIPLERGAVIRAGRELCATRGLFITKKRYAVMIFDKEGKRKDVDGRPGEIKVMGLDLKRSDTPKPVQDFLFSVLTAVLEDQPQEDVFEMIKLFRQEFTNWPSWAKGSPKRVNNLTQYGQEEDHSRPRLGGHQLEQPQRDLQRQRQRENSRWIQDYCMQAPTQPHGTTQCGLPSGSADPT